MCNMGGIVCGMFMSKDGGKKREENQVSSGISKLKKSLDKKDMW